VFAAWAEQKKPAEHGFAVADAEPGARQKPVLPHAAHAALDADCEALLYVPTGHASRSVPEGQ
jgi:hypothetical protein